MIRKKKKKIYLDSLSLMIHPLLVPGDAGQKALKKLKQVGRLWMSTCQVLIE